jgi:hypothetical protein
MTVTSKTQPLCRNCGKPIRKSTRTIRFGARADSDRPWPYGIERTAKPTSFEEAARLTNQQIVGVRWTVPSRLKDGDFVDTGEPRFISEAFVWDGETFDDDLFDTGRCAQEFGRNVARSHNLAAPAYNRAILARNTKETPHNA